MLALPIPLCYNTFRWKQQDKIKDMRECWNWQTGQTKDLVVIAIVWVQVPSPAYAEVAELADAHGSGPCGSDTVRVRVSSSA